MNIMKAPNLAAASLLAASALGFGAPTLWAQPENEKKIVEFDEANIFFEFNSTDLDLGIQIFFDATGWEKVTVKGPDGKVFDVRNGGGLKQIGSTEVFTESEEPLLDEEDLEAAMAAFMAKFPAGEYTFEGKTIGGERLVGSAELTHDLPAPVALMVGEFPNIAWIPTPNGVPVTGYEIVIEMVVQVDEDEEREFVNTATFPASVTSFTVAEQFMDMVLEFTAAETLLELKVEIIASEASGNKTITEVVLFDAED
jgi:hypothetical protein